MMNKIKKFRQLGKKVAGRPWPVTCTDKDIYILNCGEYRISHHDENVLEYISLAIEIAEGFDKWATKAIAPLSSKDGHP